METLEHVEFELKFKVEDHLLIEFKQLLESMPDERQFTYVEGLDQFFTYPDSWFKLMPQWDPAGTFIRYRKPSYGLDNGRRQVTWKYKPAGAKNNIKRKEHNWDIGDTAESTLHEQLQDSGATFNMQLVKTCHVYKLKDATMVFYTVYDTTDGTPKRSTSFIEVEVCEELIAGLNEEQAWDIARKYEKLLAPLGITPNKRMDRSLFEIYRR